MGQRDYAKPDCVIKLSRTILFPPHPKFYLSILPKEQGRACKHQRRLSGTEVTWNPREKQRPSLTGHARGTEKAQASSVFPGRPHPAWLHRGSQSRAHAGQASSLWGPSASRHLSSHLSSSCWDFPGDPVLLRQGAGGRGSVPGQGARIPHVT